MQKSGGQKEDRVSGKEDEFNLEHVVFVQPRRKHECLEWCQPSTRSYLLNTNDATWIAIFFKRFLKQIVS